MKRLLTFLTLLTLFFSIGWATTTAEKTMNKIVDDNNYTISAQNSEVCYTSFSLDDNITISTTGTPNCGSFWKNANTGVVDWRLYRAKNGNVIITAASGYTLNSITITYSTSNSGTLTGVTSGTAVSVSGSSAEFVVANTNSNTNGQVRITAISVTYSELSSGLNDPSISFSGFTAGGTTVTATITPDENATTTYYRIGETGNFTTYSSPVSIDLTTNTSPIKVYAYSTDDNETTDPVYQEYNVPTLGISISPSSYTGYDEKVMTITATNYVGEPIITYTINGGNEIDYDGPFTLSDPDTYEIVATVLDERAGDENEATSSATIIIKGAAAIPLPFEENFNAAQGSGPVVGETWGGSIAADAFASDNEGWTYTNNAYAGNGCARFGTSGKAGNATTPLISEFTAGAEYKLTFKAGAWNGAGTTLSLSSENGTFKDTEGNDLTSVTISQNAWTDFEVIFVPSATTAKITFTNSSKQFFLDDVKVEARVAETHEIFRVFKSNGENNNNAQGWIGYWSDNCSMPEGDSGDDYKVIAAEGQTVSFLVGRNNSNYMILPEYITAVDGDNHEVTLNIGEMNANGQYPVSFTMPESDVTITVDYPYNRATLRLAGRFNGGTEGGIDDRWIADSSGPKFKYTYRDDEGALVDNYTMDVYFIGASNGDGQGTMGDYFWFRVNDTDLKSNNVWGDNNDWINEGDLGQDLTRITTESGRGKFFIRAGVYKITINGALTTVRFDKQPLTMGFDPEAGEVVAGTPVNVVSSLKNIVADIKANYDSGAKGIVTVQVSTNGTEFTDGETVTVNEATTVYGKAYIGNILEEGNASYTIKEVDSEILPFSEAFNGNDFGKFTSDGVAVGDVKIWTIATVSNVKCAKATGYIGGSNHAAVSWLKSPYIDLRNTTNPQLSFEQCVNKFFGENNIANEAELYIKVYGDNGDGDKQTISYPSINSGNWSAFEEQVVDLTDYIGEIIQIGFKYTSTADAAGTWEIRNLKVEDFVPTVATPVFSPEGGTYTEAKEVTISCKTEDATILYSTDGETYTAYTDAITVSETTTLYAKATKTGYNESEVATATYTIVEPGEWHLVTEVGDIQTGRKYIIVNNDLDRTIGEYYSTGQVFYSVECENRAEFYPDNTATVTGSDITIFEFEFDGTTIYMKDANSTSYYYPVTNGSEIKKTDSGNKTPVYVTVEDNFAYIKSDPNSTKSIAYNYQNSLHYFGSYASPTTTGNQRPVYLYYSEAEAPIGVTLAELCQSGQEGKLYKITEGITGIYQKETSVWYKDANGKSIWKNIPNDTDLDYKVNKTNQKEFDQSNWIEVVFDDADNAEYYSADVIKNMTGRFENKLNPKLILTKALTDDNVVPSDLTNPEYTPNPYMPANFMGSQNYNDGEQTVTYFFAKPKPQEYATITYAYWDGSKFTMPESEGDINHFGFEGEFEIDLSMNSPTTNPAALLSEAMDDGEMKPCTYTFKGIICKVAAQQPATGGEAPAIKANRAGESYKVYALDLDAGSPVTAISTVKIGNGEVKSVKYVNVAGIVSDTPFQGVNIVVTEYTDGSRTTTKMLRK